MELELVIFVGILCGVLARAFLPYWRKLVAGEKLEFQMRYLAIVVASIITVVQVFPSYTPILDSLLVTFWAAATFGFGLQALYTEIYAWLEGAVERTQQK